MAPEKLIFELREFTLSMSSLNLPSYTALVCLLFCSAVPSLAGASQTSATANNVKGPPANTNSSSDPSFARIRPTKPGLVESPSKVRLLDGSEVRSLPALARETMRRYLLGHKQASMRAWAESLQPAGKLKRKAGVFVTFSKNGKTRACWGSVYPREADLLKETVLASMGALSKEYRYKKIRAAEIDELKVQVAVINDIVATNRYEDINPFRDGVMVRAGGRGAVILPGEATDAYYEVVMAKLKAGIEAKAACQIYKLKVEVYEQSASS